MTLFCVARHLYNCFMDEVNQKSDKDEADRMR